MGLPVSLSLSPSVSISLSVSSLSLSPLSLLRPRGAKNQKQQLMDMMPRNPRKSTVLPIPRVHDVTRYLSISRIFKMLRSIQLQRARAQGRFRERRVRNASFLHRLGLEELGVEFWEGLRQFTVGG